MTIWFNKLSALAACTVMVAVNYLAVSLPLAGRSTGEISDSYPNLFAPAGYTFSIWGIIYAMLAVYLVYQFTRREEKLISRINSIFTINAFLNASWIFAWHHDLIWSSFLIMIGIFATLVLINEMMRSNKLTRKERWMVFFPFNVYFGWITVAMIANFIVLMVSLNRDGSVAGSPVTTVIALIVGALVGLWGMLRYRALPFGLVLIWAYAGILSKHLSEYGFAGQYPAVIYTVVLCIFMFMVLMLATNIRSRASALK